MNEKGQGALEYLIIVAAVLAIAAVVVVILSGTLGGSRRSVSVGEIKSDASACAKNVFAPDAGKEQGNIYEAGNDTGTPACHQICSEWTGESDIATVTTGGNESLADEWDEMNTDWASVEPSEDDIKGPYGACVAAKPSWITSK